MTIPTNLHSGARILIVDDEEIQRALTRDSLEDAGFVVDEAADGEDGIRRAFDFAPDLVLLDVMMPGINGFETCRRLRADPRTRRLPIVIVTGCEESSDIDEGMQAGASDFLTKPLNWKLLPNRVSYVLQTSRLESDLRKSRDMLQRSLKVKSTMIATMSHELRTPLNSIIGFSSLLEAQSHGPLGSSEYEEFAADIHRAGLQLLKSINLILEINDIDSENRTIRACRQPLGDVVKSAVAKAKAEFGSWTDLTYRLDLQHEHMMLEIDDGGFARGLFQIISNAIKFNDENGEVVIQSRITKNGNLSIRVADTGIGIAPEDIDRVLQPFEQVDNRLARRFEGLGLGLPLARALMRMHGGSLRIASEPGRGTHVTVVLPPSCMPSMPTAVSA